MNKLKWCFEQKRGLEFIEPNANLSKEYIEEANDTLENMFVAKGKWRVIIAYYACYNALYSVLMKAGVKSEIHDCTIALMSILPDFEKEDIELIEALKRDRIDAQYYLKDVELKDESKIKAFVLKCKTLLNNLDIDEFRTILREEI
ncbi:hypothetical protein DRJ17_04915 [Candidatus Woesearchaeota archaeon]|nr:MAG: hypothetical protein DRJ17_04915 [Candidatus Woesearchaeota archaeon]